MHNKKENITFTYENVHINFTAMWKYIVPFLCFFLNP